MVQILGKMPEPWWSTTWTERRVLYEDNVDFAGRPVSTGDEDEEDENEAYGGRATIRYHPSIAYGARSLRDKLLPGLWYLDSDQSHRQISDDEIKTFSDLLEQLLQWKPEDRLSAEAALQHAWFKM
jgi:serine/threonine protein kinase